MTTAQLLEATGNIWYVQTFQHFGKGLKGPTVFVRASSQEKAAEVAKRQTGFWGVPAPWNPATDYAVRSNFRIVTETAPNR